MLKRILGGLLIVIIAGFGAFAVLVYRPALPAIAAIATFAPELVTKGEILAGAGNCASCHSVKGAAPYSDGYAMETSFGTNLNTYTPLRINDVPEMDIQFVESSNVPVGLGEPATTVIAPAIGNAIFAATGARLRHIPITSEAILAALKNE